MSKGAVKEIATSDKGALKRFVAFERQLAGSNPLFVSDIDDDVVNRLSGRSMFFSESECALFVASNGARDVARCAALINRRYQKAKQEAVGFIGHFAAMPECGPEVDSMIQRAEAWLKARGVTRVIAPYNGAAVLGLGLLTAAFDEEPMFPFMWHPPYYADYIVRSGYQPTYPLWYYTIDFSSEKYQAARQRAAQNNAVSVRSVSKKHWNRDLETLGQVFNESFLEEWEFHPYRSEEFHEFFDPIKPVLDPRLMLIGEVNGEPAGWCVGFPDWNPLFRSFNGKLGPLQILKLMLGAGRYRRGGLIGIGVLTEYKGNGLAHALATTLYRRFEALGLKEAFYYPVNERNSRSRKFAESMGGRGRVLYHCYDKRLDG